MAQVLDRSHPIITRIVVDVLNIKRDRWYNEIEHKYDNIPKV
jgi:hypothetical protein